MCSKIANKLKILLKEAFFLTVFDLNTYINEKGLKGKIRT